MQSRARGGDDLRNMMIKDDHAGPPIPKAKGRVQAPNGADGAPCRWDELKGGWLESDGTPYDKKAAAARKKARQRAARSEEQARAARGDDAARQQARRAAFTAEQARAERDAHAAAEQARRAAFTAEQARAEREAHAAAEQARRAAFTAEQARAEHDAKAAAHQARRAMLGWTPLKQASSLPTGPREQQLLFDTHGSGAAFLTVNSSRLRTLEEGSALHAECVEDTAKDMELLCPVDILDHERMVTAFVERKKEAEKLHVCGTCGVRDPSMWYSKPIKLADIPAEHWCRIDPRAYARLLAEPPIWWIKRGHDGTFNEKTATGVTVSGLIRCGPMTYSFDGVEIPGINYDDLTYNRPIIDIGVACKVLGCTNDIERRSMLKADVDVKATYTAGVDNKIWVEIPYHEFYTKFEWQGQAFHVAPEAVEWLTDDGTHQRDAPEGQFPHIRVCKHCHGAWNRPRGDPVGPSPPDPPERPDRSSCCSGGDGLGCDGQCDGGDSAGVAPTAPTGRAHFSYSGPALHIIGPTLPIISEASTHRLAAIGIHPADADKGWQAVDLPKIVGGLKLVMRRVELYEAASVIGAWWRGYRTRRAYLDEGRESCAESEVRSDDESMSSAASEAPSDEVRAHGRFHEVEDGCEPFG